MRYLEDLLKDIHYPEINEINKDIQGITVSQITFNSKDVRPGGLFVAIRGFEKDGHHFIDEAINRGAVAVIGEDSQYQNALPVPYILVKNSRKTLSKLAASWFNYPSCDLTLIGVTGTKGKTSTVHLISQILHLMGYKVGYWSSLEIYDGEVATSRPSFQTTPDSVTLQNFLFTLRKNKIKIGVLEVTSHALDQYRVHHTFFDVALLTNIEAEHIEYHGSLEAYLRAKKRLFAYLEVSRQKARKSGVAILNRDSQYWWRFAASGRYPVKLFSLRAPADFFVANISYDIRKNISHFSVVFDKNKEVDIDLYNSISESQIYNTVSALAAVYAVVEDLPKSLSLDASIEGRFSFIEEGQPFKIIYDYAHTPQSLKSVLFAARKMLSASKGRLLVLLGISGRRDHSKRFSMGRIAAKMSDFVVLTSMDWYPEEPLEKILADIAKGAMSVKHISQGRNLHCIHDRSEAIHFLLSHARERDVVVIVGKGHEKVIIQNGVVYPWSEKDVILKSLKRLGFG